MSRTAVDDAPLITRTATPRAPLGVRRATPEIPRAKARITPAGHSETLFEMPPAAVVGERFEPRQHVTASGDSLAGPVRRVMAALIDIALLGALDALVVYFTVRLLGLRTGDVLQLPLLPLAAFFLLLNGGYFVAFTPSAGSPSARWRLGSK